MDPGTGYGRHRHVGSEDVLVLAGGYRDELGEYRQGDCVHYPAGSSHAPVALGDRARPIGPENPSCVLFAVAPLGIELL
jgi:anti-sigma factor ChrR (cupin superfamily)